MNTIIFLDVDGVLNTVPPTVIIMQEKVRLLAQIVHSADAKLVLHSGWRIWFSADMQPLTPEAVLLTECLANAGLQLHSSTPDLTTEEIRRTRSFSLVKAREISAWLAAHTQVKSYLVLDDLDLHDEQIAAHQIRPDQRTGLSEENVQQALRFLANG